MPEKVAFIGRENELAFIDHKIQEWGTLRIVCIEAEGGIGKTCLLQQIRQRYRQQASPDLLITDIIDFDDHTFHQEENLTSTIARMLDESIFHPYLEGLLQYRRLEKAGENLEGRKQAFLENFFKFASCLNKITRQKRIVLFFDTTEALAEKALIKENLFVNHFAKIGKLLKNGVILIAGRNASSLGELLQQELSRDVVTIRKMAPFNPDESAQYLRQKEQLMYINLEPDLTQKLIFLAGGKPILIDLAVEWRNRGISLDWLLEEKFGEMTSLPEAKIPQYRQEFERELVKHVIQTRKPIDWLLLLMSHVYPLDVEMIALFLDMTTEEADALFQKAKTYVFVKNLPDGRIMIHDEMRRMIQEYVWPVVDPQKQRQRSYSKQAVQYLARRIEDLQTYIHQLQQTVPVTEKNDPTAKTSLSFAQIDLVEKEFWMFKKQLLTHNLIVGITEGVQAFCKIFDEATQAYRYAFREALLEQTLKYRDQLSQKQQYEIDIRQAKYLLDMGKYPEANELLKNIGENFQLRPEQHIDLLIQRANIEIRLGKFQEGKTYFERALQNSRVHNLKKWIAKAETGLGWAYRLTADFQEAGKHYENALDLVIEEESKESKHQQALLYGNLGFVYAYYTAIPGHREKAVWFCEQALALWKELSDERGKGRAYSTLGCVKFMNGQFEEALINFQKALDIFEPVNDQEWLSIVYSWRGAVYISKEQFDLAQENLHTSLRMGILKDQPITLSRLGQVYLCQGRLDEAQKYIAECHKLALELPDVWYQLVSLRDMTRLALYTRKYDQLEKFEQLLQDYCKKWGDPKDVRALGMLYLNIGLLSLGKSNIDKAVTYFCQGLQILSRQDRYGNDTFQTHIKRLQDVMEKDLQLSPQQIKNVREQLLVLWPQEKLLEHSDIRIILSKWIKEGSI